jgi:hypothetical protein
LAALGTGRTAAPPHGDGRPQPQVVDVLVDILNMCSLHPHDAALLLSVHEAARAEDVPIGAILSDHAVRPAACARRAPCHLFAPRSSWPETFTIQRVLVTVTGVMIYRLPSR